MLTQIGMPQGAEWLILLGIVVLLFGSTRLPQLARSLGKSKKAWEEEIGSAKKSAQIEGTETTAEPTPQQPVQQPVQQQPQGPQVNGTAPGDTPPQSN